MPKINVYLPDDLAVAVKAADLPVSAICQKALADAVQTIGTARKGIEALRSPDFDPDSRPQFAARLSNLMTAKLRQAIELAWIASPGRPHIGTADLLIGVLDQGDNFAIRVLETFELDIAEIREAASHVDLEEPLPTAAVTNDAERSLWSGLTLPARVAIGNALEASIDLGHNYIGCEHLLLGLVSDPTSGSARVLHELGLDGVALRRAVVSALAGYAHARQSAPAATSAQLDRLAVRLDVIDRRLNAAGL